MGLCLQPDKDPRKTPFCTPAPFWICCFQQISLQMESRRKDWPECDDLLSPRSRTIMLVYNMETIYIITIDESLEHGLLEISRSYCSSRSVVSKRRCGEARRPASNCSKTISRLQTANEVPELPKENILVSGIDSTRRLSISRENEIANNSVRHFG